MDTTPEQAIQNLDTVREIILSDTGKLNMGNWHEDNEWRDRTCAEEATCGTSHCLAGWLQVCATDQELRKLHPEAAGAIQAPIAAKMFYKDNATVRLWLQDRIYVSEYLSEPAQ